MDQERALDIEGVTKAMDATRESIRDTVEELRGRVQESADWRTHVTARPIASLLVAAACGVALARILVPVASLARIPLLLAPRIIRRAPPPLASGWSTRLSGAAGLATQLAALPSLISQIRQLIRRTGSKNPR